MAALINKNEPLKHMLPTNHEQCKSLQSLSSELAACTICIVSLYPLVLRSSSLVRFKVINLPSVTFKHSEFVYFHLALLAFAHLVLLAFAHLAFVHLAFGQLAFMNVTSLAFIHLAFISFIHLTVIHYHLYLLLAFIHLVFIISHYSHSIFGIHIFSKQKLYSLYIISYKICRI